MFIEPMILLITENMGGEYVDTQIYSLTLTVRDYDKSKPKTVDMKSNDKKLVIKAFNILTIRK